MHACDSQSHLHRGVDDVADGVLAAATTDRATGVFNLSSGNPVAVRQIVEMLRAMHPEAVHLEDLATRSPAPVMRGLLDEVARRYGSATEYLRAHGLDDSEIAELRRVLLRRDA